MFESLFEALQMSFMQRALAATLAMSLLCPVMGLFLVLRRSSMTGDALSHSSLAGAAAALALGVNPVVGTFVFTAVCGLMIEALRSCRRCRSALPSRSSPWDSSKATRRVFSSAAF